MDRVTVNTWVSDRAEHSLNIFSNIREFTPGSAERMGTMDTQGLAVT
jgi:hypothetical protein